MTESTPAEAGAEAVVEQAPADNTDKFIDKAIAEDQEPSPQPEPKKEPEATDDVPFPKKAVNAISRRDKKIGELRAREQQLRAELAKYQQPQPENTTVQPKGAQEPVPQNFRTWGDYEAARQAYLRDQISSTVEQKMAESAKQQQTAAEQAKEQAWKEDRYEALAENSGKAKAAIPDYQQTLDEYADVIAALPPHVERALLEADNPAYAFYALAKDGALEQLAGMSPEKAAMTIARAEDKALAQAKTKPVTKTPEPLSANKGGSASPGSFEARMKAATTSKDVLKLLA